MFTRIILTSFTALAVLCLLAGCGSSHGGVYIKSMSASPTVVAPREIVRIDAAIGDNGSGTQIMIVPYVVVTASAGVLYNSLEEAQAAYAPDPDVNLTIESPEGSLYLRAPNSPQEVVITAGAGSEQKSVTITVIDDDYRPVDGLAPDHQPTV